MQNTVLPFLPYISIKMHLQRASTTEKLWLLQKGESIIQGCATHCLSTVLLALKGRQPFYCILWFAAVPNVWPHSKSEAFIVA